MKKGVYIAILAIVTVGCIIGGTVYRAIGIGKSIANHSSFRQEFDGEYIREDKKLNLKENAFNEISVDTCVMDVTIVSGDDYEISYECSEKLAPTYEVQDGVLVVKQNGKHDINFWTFESIKCSMTITVPEDVKLDSVVVKSDVGDIEIHDVEADRFDVGASVGDIYFKNADLGNTKIDADTGDIDIDGCSFGNLSIDNSVGDVEIRTDQDLNDYSLDLSTDIGDVKYNDHNNGHKYETSGSNGMKIEIDNSTGDISIYSK